MIRLITCPRCGFDGLKERIDGWHDCEGIMHRQGLLDSKTESDAFDSQVDDEERSQEGKD